MKKRERNVTRVTGNGFSFVAVRRMDEARKIRSVAHIPRELHREKRSPKDSLNQVDNVIPGNGVGTTVHVLKDRASLARGVDCRSKRTRMPECSAPAGREAARVEFTRPFFAPTLLDTVVTSKKQFARARVERRPASPCQRYADMQTQADLGQIRFCM